MKWPEPIDGWLTTRCPFVVGAVGPRDASSASPIVAQNTCASRAFRDAHVTHASLVARSTSSGLVSVAQDANLVVRNSHGRILTLNDRAEFCGNVAVQRLFVVTHRVIFALLGGVEYRLGT